MRRFKINDSNGRVNSVLSRVEQLVNNSDLSGLADIQLTIEAEKQARELLQEALVVESAHRSYLETSIHEEIAKSDLLANALEDEKEQRLLLEQSLTTEQNLRQTLEQRVDDEKVEREQLANLLDDEKTLRTSLETSLEQEKSERELLADRLNDEVTHRLALEASLQDANTKLMELDTLIDAEDGITIETIKEQIKMMEGRNNYIYSSDTVSEIIPYTHHHIFFDTMIGGSGGSTVTLNNGYIFNKDCVAIIYVNFVTEFYKGYYTLRQLTIEKNDTNVFSCEYGLNDGKYSILRDTIFIYLSMGDTINIFLEHDSDVNLKVLDNSYIVITTI